MSNINNILKEADPLQAESEPSMDEYSSRRQAILNAAAGMTRAREKAGTRVSIYVTVVLIAVVAVVAGVRLWPPFVKNVQAALRFEVRLAEQKPAPGLIETNEKGGGKLYLHPEVIVSNSDIAEAKVLPQPGGAQFWISVTFTPAGAKKMYAATRKNIHKRMAILIDGEVVTAPVVMDPLKEAAVVNGNITKEEAERIVAGITIH